MKANSLRSKSKPELKQDLVKKEAELQKLRFDLSFNKLKDVKALSRTKRDIARIMTLLREE